MTTDDHPQARRLRRPGWRDPRLGIGVLLVAGSVALGTWAVHDAAETVDVYAAAGVLVPGSVLDAEDLAVREVRLGADEGLYLPLEELPAEAVITRTVGAGELVPRSALGAPGEVDLRPMILDLGPATPATLGPGALVDLWFVPPAPLVTGVGEEAEAPEPELLAAEVVVAGVVEDESVLASARGTSVEVRLPREDVGTVLTALAADGQFVAVPTTSAPHGGGEAAVLADEDE